MQRPQDWRLAMSKLHRPRGYSRKLAVIRQHRHVRRDPPEAEATGMMLQYRSSGPKLTVHHYNACPGATQQVGCMHAPEGGAQHTARASTAGVVEPSCQEVLEQDCTARPQPRLRTKLSGQNHEAIYSTYTCLLSSLSYRLDLTCARCDQHRNRAQGSVCSSPTLDLVAWMRSVQFAPSQDTACTQTLPPWLWFSASRMYRIGVYRYPCPACKTQTRFGTAPARTQHRGDFQIAFAMFLCTRVRMFSMPA